MMDIKIFLIFLNFLPYSNLENNNEGAIVQAGLSK
jgi:hypothetical protein